jgi:acrylyl-CoA reductase (NADPH)
MPRTSDTFRALVLDRHGDEVAAQVREMQTSALPDGDVTVRIEWSGVNYKDALAVTNRGKIVRRFPMVPGIDLAGSVRESQSRRFGPGDRVILTGYGTGEDCWGGYAKLARSYADYLVPTPESMSSRQAMAAGTAGFTAILGVMALADHGVTPEEGPVLVTGASGGVGSFAVALLAGRGFDVAASTGRAETHDYLRQLGASSIVDRTDLAAPPERPLQSEKWQGAIDSVGGTTLANMLTAVRRHGCVASCGLAGGHELETTVFPLILRGVILVGIDSNYCPMPRRERAWRALADELGSHVFETVADTQAQLEEVPDYCLRLLSGGVRGRVLVRLTDSG